MATQKKPVPADAPFPRFARWIRSVGELEIARRTGVTYHTVFKWRQYADGMENGARPRPEHLTALVLLAGGQLKLSDIYATPTLNK